MSDDKLCAIDKSAMINGSTLVILHTIANAFPLALCACARWYHTFLSTVTRPLQYLISNNTYIPGATYNDCYKIQRVKEYGKL